MKTMKKILAATFAVAALVVPMAARAAGGDIFEIRPVNENGVAVSNPTDYLVGGDTVRFAVRLAKPESSGNPFRLVHTGLNSEAVDLLVNRPAIGIYVNGVFTLAYLESVKARSEIFTDFIFTYTVKPGDFALPIMLADSNKNLVTDTTQPAAGYYLNFLDATLGTAAWKVDNSVDGGAVATRTANFWYGTPDYKPSAPESDGRRSDYTLALCEFNVKTVDFDSNDESSTYWRTIHRHATEAQPVGYVPSIVVSGMPTNSATLYVWSENPEAVEVIAGRDVSKVSTLSVHTSKTETVSRQVGEIKIIAGKQEYEFNLRGVAATNDATIVVSAFKDFNYNAGTSDRIEDYLTRKVQCIGPLPASVTIKPGKSAVTATSDYQTYVTELNVSLSENPVGHDFDVVVSNAFTEAGSAVACPNKWWDYFRVAASTDADPTLTQPTGYPTLRFEAGKTMPSSITVPTAGGDVTTPINDGKLYLFALRSDAYVTGTKKLSFAVTTTDSAALKPSSAGGIDGWNVLQSSLTINAQDPVVESMFDGTDYATAVAGEPRTLQIVVSDVYADMTSQTGGYEIWIEKNTDTDTKFTQLPGLYRPGKGNVLFLTNTVDTLPTVVYTEPVTNKSVVYVVSPITGNQSANHNFRVAVSTPAGYTVETTDGAEEYYEGDIVQVKITLDKANTSGDMYAFIIGESSNATELIDCKWKGVEGGVGRLMRQYDTTLSSGCKFELLDGDASNTGTTYSYEIVFLNQQTWTTNASARVTAYKQKNTLSLTTHNVLPRVDYIDINNGNYEIYDADTVVGPFPINMPQTFRAYVDEPGRLDKEATGDDAFVVRWRFKPESGSPDTLTVAGNPDDAVTNYTFTSAGIYTVDVDLQDKDIAPRFANRDADSDEGYAKTGLNKKFTFKVEVIDQPTITVEHDGSYSETSSVDAGGEASLKLKLSLNDCTFPMDVKMLIAPNNKSSAAPGTFLLQTSSSVTSNGVEVFEGEPYESYTVRFPRQTLEMPIFVQTMDGTADSRTTGFKVVVTNITTTVVPGTGQRACDYYLGVSPTAIKVLNEAPALDSEVDVYPVPSTNSIPASIGAADEAITWTFDDVELDFKRGMTVEFKGGGGWGPKTYTNRVDALADGAAGFVPVFGGSGSQVVKLIIKDPDNGSTTVNWNYTVEASKSMSIVAHGPGSGDVSKYDSAAGLGKGRVWAESKSAIAVSSFASTINCGLETSWNVFGYGYKVGDIDDGANLHTPDGFGGYLPSPYIARDTKINTRGSNLGAAETPYSYIAPFDDRGNQVDSFLYAWMVKSADKESGSSGFAFLNETTAPEYVAIDGDSGKSATLPSETDDAGNYVKTTIEAIFSIEYLASDNMGDINLDGIPDAYVNKYKFGGDSTAEAGTDDLASLSRENTDADFLPPSGVSDYGTLIPGLAGTWVTAGRPFTAKLEIRGNGESLNDAPENNSLTRVANLMPDRVYTDPRIDTKSTLDGYDGAVPVEYLAWLDYAAANGLDPTDKANWTAWSPERPTDPTVDDTDGDGLPDGYEYFIWYRAHVGYSDGGVHRYLTGRKYDPRNPGEGKFIAAEDVAALFDPVVANGAFYEDQDTDNDGLPDLVEFAIGTNPINFDTDGDGLPDGFEILIAGTDPLEMYSTRGVSDAMRNYDGDAMAYSSPAHEENYVFPAPKHITALGKFALVDANGDTDGIQWYVMPLADIPTNTMVYADVATPGYIVKAGGVDYVTTVKPAVVSNATAFSLAADLPRDATWTTGIYTNTDDSVKLIRLMPTRLVAGTRLDAEPDTATTTNFGYVAFSSAVKDSLTAWPYGRAVNGLTTGSNNANLGGFGFLAIGRYKDAPAGAMIAALPVEDATIAYLHHQVYQEFGFDPRTAWNAKTPIGARWGSNGDSVDESGDTISESKANMLNVAFPYVGLATRTREYTLYDEFLLLSFFLNGGATMDVRPATDNTWHTIWSRYTTNGHGPNEASFLAATENYKGRETIEGSPDENGADTDGDGVPDGWELYVMAGKKRYDATTKKYYFRSPAPYGDGYLSSFGPFEPHAKNASYTDNTASDGNDTAGGDGDGLTEWQEFAGTDTTLYYADYSTTVTRPVEYADWLNKFFPTDPWNGDTDGDGLTDKRESGKKGDRGLGHGFVYGTPADDGKLATIPGGGLNPLSVDTDFDGLPDGWEWQFNGETVYAGDDAVYVKVDGADAGNPLQGLVDGMDGTVPDAYNAVNGSVDDDGKFGTATLTRVADGSKMFASVNRDYDHDGLENWQEYMVGTMRSWRYDDILTPWDPISDAMYWNAAGIFSPDYAAINAKFGKPGEPVIDTTAADGGDGEFWFKTLVDKTSPIYNPRLLSDQIAGAHYLTHVDNPWDVAYLEDSKGGAWYYFKDRIGDDSLSDLWVKPFIEASGKLPKVAFVAVPSRYISCSPLESDSDHDGMDDYYELFHGMNPMLGASGVPRKDAAPCDIVFDAWYADGADTLFEAWNASDILANNWTFQTAVGNYYKTGAAPRGTGYDFEYYPWLNGLAAADPDGDDVRNQVEAIMPTMATKTWLHTDPTPLWMTDSNYERSLTRMNYRMPGRDLFVPTPGETFEYDGKTYYFCDFAGWAPKTLLLPERFAECQQDIWWRLYAAGERNWMFSFEENEGYDTDHDAMSDSTETEGKLRAASDPQDANSPNRRQAMYFQGPAKPSALQTPPEVVERYPVATETWPDETTFMTFTVEAWVYAESLADATVVERAIWCDPSKPGDEEFVRKNFQVGVRGGKWYAKYDPNGTLVDGSVEVYSETDAKANEWHHIAATYDGANFTLYLDGENAATPVPSTRQPEYGSSALVLHRVASSGNSVNAHGVGDYWYDADYALRTIVVGASLKTQAEGGSQEAFDVRNGVGWGRYNRFFKGYVDEVRIWDGARPIADIRADVRARSRYTREMALANRAAFFADWQKVGMRNRYMKDANGDAFVLTPELCYLFSFDSVPGGGDADITAKVPAGFDFYQPPALGNPERGAAILARPLDWKVAWWDRAVNGDGTAARPGFGSVYSSAQWVQWVPNTVAHLPRFDGTTLDSFFWSDNTCGGTNGTYRFANTAEPASTWKQLVYNGATRKSDYATSGARHHLVCELDGIVFGSTTNEFHYDRFEQLRFTGRHALVDGVDLLPLGGAFAKTIDTMWDAQGASTPWEITSDDSDFNGLPDSWEEFAVANYSPETEPLEWGTIVNWKGTRMTAGEAYKHDLAKGRTIDTNSSGDAEVSPTEKENLKQIADEDASRTPDWWDDMYGVYGQGGTTDTDNDGLNNYVEYLVGEIFPFGIVLDPKKPMSDSKTLDYFRKVGKLYLGEMFTDHDHVEDHWERALGNETINASVWDAQRDGDEDGWSNYAERRSVDDKSTWIQVGSETNLYTVTFDYNSNEQKVFDSTNEAPIVATEWFGAAEGWVVGTGRLQTIPTKVRYTLVGYTPIMGYGGHPTPKVDLTVYYNGGKLVGQSAQLVVLAYSSDDMFVPDAIFTSNTVVRGVNKITLHETEFGVLKGGRNNFVAYMIGSVEGSGNGGGNSGGGSSAESGSTIPDYVVGMPFGVASDVEVGWNSAHAEILLSDASAITPRIKLWDAASSDRIAIFGSMQTASALTPTVPTDEIVRVRVVRYMYDTTSVGANSYRVMLDRSFRRSARDYIHEGDFLENGVFDIDWLSLKADLSTRSSFATCTNVTYAVILGDAPIPNNMASLPQATTAHPVLISRRFEKNRTRPTIDDSGNGESVCHVAQPTFRWRIDNEDKWASAFGTTYTAFRIVVKDVSSNEVYNSGYQRMPVADTKGVYSWTAPLYVDCPSPSGSHLVFKNFERYTWRVFTYNSKFKDDDAGLVNGSDPKTFRMNVTEMSESSYSTAIDVRYAGPATITSTNGAIHVQAFKTPDFVGDPVAEVVTNGVATVKLVGLMPGTYFLRAYIDTDNDGSLDNWESWGYLSERDHASVTGTKSIFNPVSVTVGPEIKGETPRILYIEDRDIDGDGFPDAWEAEQNGYVFDREFVKPVSGDAEFFAVNTNLTSVLNSTDTMDPAKKDLLMQTLKLTMGGKYGVSLLTGIPVASLRMSSAGAIKLGSKVVADSVAITSLGIDRSTNDIVLGVAATAEADGVDSAVTSLYVVELDTEFTVKVYRTETLAANWELVAEEKMTITSDGTEIRAPLPKGVDMSSGFFKVEIE